MKFDHGQQVRYKHFEEADPAAGKLAWVVAITPIETAEQAKLLGHPRGIALYTVEFEDGTDKLVPESDLQKI